MHFSMLSELKVFRFLPNAFILRGHKSTKKRPRHIFRRFAKIMVFGEFPRLNTHFSGSETVTKNEAESVQKQEIVKNPWFFACAKQNNRNFNTFLAVERKLWFFGSSPVIIRMLAGLEK